MQLLEVFEEINRQHFDGFLTAPRLAWNSRLRSSSGRFHPGSRVYWDERPALIEIASYLLRHADAEKHIRDTMAHEMIHYWLWVRRRPYGHTDEFYAKMRLMGVSRYNPVPRLTAPKYIYACPKCGKEFPAQRVLKPVACSECCRRYARGKYSNDFRLVLKHEPSRDERAAMKREAEREYAARLAAHAAAEARELGLAAVGVGAGGACDFGEVGDSWEIREEV